MTRIVSLLLIASLFLLSGCETVKGAGRDFQKAGKWMEKSAKKN
jgi:predicted small secreted protein